MTVTQLPSLQSPPSSASSLPSSHDRPAATASGIGSEQARPLSPNEFTAVSVVAALVAVLGLLGFVNSFAAVAAAVRPSFGSLAFTVPLGIDLGIAVFAALDIVLARLDMRVRWLRLIPWTLTAATVYLNVAGEATAFGKVAHAALPALWVVAVEVAAHVVKVRAGIEAGTAMDRIRTSRWLLAPLRTAALWRRMTLWEERSYPAALDRERSRLLALTDLQDTYGPLAWRWRAPRRTKALYRLGELAPTGLPAALPAADTAPAIEAATTPDTSTATGKESGPSRRPAKRSRTTGRTAGRAAAKAADREADALALLAADPEMSGAELGRRLKVSDRTGRRIQRRIQDRLTAAPPTPAIEAAPSAVEGSSS